MQIVQSYHNASAPEKQARMYVRNDRIYALKFVIISTISAPMRFWASTVAAPMCGVQETIGWE